METQQFDESTLRSSNMAGGVSSYVWLLESIYPISIVKSLIFLVIYMYMIFICIYVYIYIYIYIYL